MNLILFPQRQVQKRKVSSEQTGNFQLLLAAAINYWVGGKRGECPNERPQLYVSLTIRIISLGS